MTVKDNQIETPFTAADRTKLDGIQPGAEVNRPIATQAEAEAGVDNTKDMTPLRVKQAIDKFASASGEANTASNLGTGAEVFAQKIGVDLQFRTLTAGTNISITQNANDIVISATGGGGGSGEANTASNLGTGTGLFAQKSGVDLQFKSLKAGSNISLSSTATEVTISATGGATDLNGLTDVVVPSPNDGDVLTYVAANSRWEAVAPSGGGGGGGQTEYLIKLPQTGGDIKSRVAGAQGVPSGWTLTTADLDSEAQFGSATDTLVIIWPISEGQKIAKIRTWEDNPAANAVGGIKILDVETSGGQKTNSSKTKAAVYFSTVSVSPTRDVYVSIKLL